jgi:hypothetical protein
MEEPRIWPRYLGAVAATGLTFAAVHLLAVYLCLAVGWRIAGWGTQCQAPACDATPLWDSITPMVVVIAAVVVGIPAYLIVRDNAPKWLRRWVR